MTESALHELLRYATKYHEPVSTLICCMKHFHSQYVMRGARTGRETRKWTRTKLLVISLTVTRDFTDRNTFMHFPVLIVVSLDQTFTLNDQLHRRLLA